ncbi:MAG: 3-phosphoshikimate 1-carboxyvinyltransferase [Candidatus Obscuribacterales bacterium]|nr:3-phosphoshikimate 1-carboxyvinyltransferase [Candidatus Obscuribacterales bacterium]
MSTLRGTLQVPGDKSISHRALIFAALSRGESKIYGLSPAFDCISSADCLSQLGLEFEKRSAADNGKREAALIVRSPGLYSLKAPQTTLFTGNSGTSIRLIAGLVAGRNFQCSFDGDDSLRRRPMARVLNLLSQMGAEVRYLEAPNYPPFSLKGAKLEGKSFKLEQASAQVQTAVILAGLQADGITKVTLPKPARDHTARMFKYLGLKMLIQNDLELAVKRLEEPLAPFSLEIPADISSAAFFMVAAAILPGSEILLRKVSINPGRDLVLKVLLELGADIEVLKTAELCNEPVADILVKGGILSGKSIIDSERLASGIDEIPILALAAAAGHAELLVKDADELRVKESDRLSAIINNLLSAGAKITENENGFSVKGEGRLQGASKWLCYEDHRMAMTGLIANLCAKNTINVDNEACVAVSYPEFLQDLERLVKS